MKQVDPKTGKLATFITPLFVALIFVEFVDLIFAVDSVPAIFAVTQDPFIVYTSNIFAILGLRALYFALAAAMHRFKYLQFSLAVILVLVGIKIFLVPHGHQDRHAHVAVRHHRCLRPRHPLLAVEDPQRQAGARPRGKSGVTLFAANR
jgi:predicted tellurium resistance membrane protein TerC